MSTKSRQKKSVQRFHETKRNVRETTNKKNKGLKLTFQKGYKNSSGYTELIGSMSSHKDHGDNL